MYCFSIKACASERACVNSVTSAAGQLLVMGKSKICVFALKNWKEVSYPSVRNIRMRKKGLTLFRGFGAGTRAYGYYFFALPSVLPAS